MGVLDAGVGAERAGRRHLVRGVPDQEHPPRAVPVGDPLGGVPGRPAGDLHVQVGDPGGGPDVRGAAQVGEVLDALAALGVPGQVEHPLLAVVDGQQRPRPGRVGQVAGDEPPVADHLREPLGPEGDADVVEQVAAPGLPDAEPFPDGAARPVRGDQVVGAHLALLAGGPVQQARRHPVGVLLEGGQLGVETEVAAFGGMPQQHRLQVVLAAQAPRGGAESGQPPAGVDLPEQPLLLAAGQRLGLQDAVVVGEHRRCRPDVLLDPRGAEQLHGAEVVAAPARMPGGLGVPLHQQVRHAEPAEEEGRRQPHQGTAHDQDRDPVRHLCVHQLCSIRAGRWIRRTLHPSPAAAGHAGCVARMAVNSRARPAPP